MKKLLALSTLLIAFACSSQEVEHLLSPVDFAESITKTENKLLLDVRTPEEFAAGHIENAQNINFYENFEQNIASLDKDETIYIYCAKGGRSAKAAQILKENGFTVIDLEGGYTAWEAKFGKASKE